MSFLEIYYEEARDLLVEEHVPLQIRDVGGEIAIPNLSKRIVTCPRDVIVTCPRDVNTLMNQAATQRATAATAMNAVSSRSHAICTLDVTVAPPVTPTTTADDTHDEKDNNHDDDDDDDVVVTGEIRAKLTLVDLAGSERIKRTGAEEKCLKEGININKGLFVLGQCVSALSELGQHGKSASSAFIPYRDSKLTRLLQDSLGGNSRTVMVACISPADTKVDESINTLRYATRTRNIQNSALQNVVLANSTTNPAEMAALRRENQLLKEQLALQHQQKQQQQQQQKKQQTTETN